MAAQAHPDLAVSPLHGVGRLASAARQLGAGNALAESALCRTMRDITEHLPSLLADVARTGDFCGEGAVELPLLKLAVAGVGPIGLPIAPSQAEALAAVAEAAPYGNGPDTLVDPDVRRCGQIAPHAVHLDPDRWPDLLAGIVEQARTALGLADPRRLARQTHLDSLAARLAEPRVRRVLQPMLAVWAAGPPDPLDEGLQQLDGDLDRLGLDSGVLIVFDRRPDAAPIHARTALARATTPAGRDVTLFRA